MHKRLRFLLPDVRRANLVIERLRNTGVSDEHLMIVAKEDTPIDDPPANIDKTDFFGSAGRPKRLSSRLYLNRNVMKRWFGLRPDLFGEHAVPGADCRAQP